MYMCMMQRIRYVCTCVLHVQSINVLQLWKHCKPLIVYPMLKGLSYKMTIYMYMYTGTRKKLLSYMYM